MWIRSITLVIMVALWLPCSSSAASHYALSVDFASDGVSNETYALGSEDSQAAELAPQAFIDLDMGHRFGDVCLFWDIKIHVGHNQPNNIEVWLKDEYGSWESAEVKRTSPIAKADMDDWACRNWGMRWAKIRIKNVDNVAITIDAVENCFDPETDSSAYAVGAEPYPEDRCDCNQSGVPSPVLGPAGIILLATVLMLSGGVAVRILRNRRTS